MLKPARLAIHPAAIEGAAAIVEVVTVLAGLVVGTLREEPDHLRELLEADGVAGGEGLEPLWRPLVLNAGDGVAVRAGD